jgi:hypothetical protein
MRRQIVVLVCLAVLGLMTLSSHAIAQQKTAKECREEWQANKAANQANGITQKAYVAQCRRGAASAQTTATPPASPTPATTAAATGQKTAKECREEWRVNKAANQANGVTEKAYVAQCRSGAAPAESTAAPPTADPTATATGQKTVAACREEWRANKAANQANGVTEKAYVAQCRSGAAPAESTEAPAAPPPATTATPAAPAPPPTPTAAAPPPSTVPSPTANAAPGVPGKPEGANEFSTETQAKARCPTDTVVWVNLTSKIYHYSGTKIYGNTKHGAYMCEHDTAAAGMRAAKNETHP